MDHNIFLWSNRWGSCVTTETSLISQKIEDEKSLTEFPLEIILATLASPNLGLLFFFAMNKSHHEMKVKNARSITPTEPPIRFPPLTTRKAVIHSTVSRHTSL
jgi:hypothetical protein